MDSTGLLARFRNEMVDNELPYLWSDEEVYGYVDSAQTRFCKLTGGLGDVSSAVTRLAVSTATDWVNISQLILKVRDAYLLGDGMPIKVINYEDMPTAGFRFDGMTGRVRFLVLGLEPGRARLYPFPVEALSIQLVVDRLPLKSIDDADQKLEVADQHSDGLMMHIKHRAYSKQDAEAFDRGRAKDYDEQFQGYCANATRERARAIHKPRQVVYGGL